MRENGRMNAPDDVMPWFSGLLDCEASTVVGLVPGGSRLTCASFTNRASSSRVGRRSRKAQGLISPGAQWEALSAEAGFIPGAEPPVGYMEAEQWAPLLEAVPPRTRYLTAYWRAWVTGEPAGTPSPTRICNERYRVHIWDREALHTAADDPTFEGPAYLWDSERSFVIATGYDFDSTIVGCSSGVATTILSDGRLEAAPVSRDLSLAFDGDRINPLGE